ncbi:GNAT family N-acetyltransferase [Paracoccus zeaxanthinifaciens]|uniref:GNAT family N-acetyltransferase n=1 Tax=Paracoccus zeaxanthinifaciens TaxID=187400 RepID=UPI0003B6F59A|nr:GNAT family N-acetyltransferase [Paracoccus zeaxanthinifaciens]
MIAFRKARAGDLPRLVEMLGDDVLGATREGADMAAYRAAFDRIDADPNQLLVVAETDGRVVGQLQLSFIPGLSLQGTTRGQIEAVRVASDMRGAGIGGQMIEWAIACCRERGCGLVQLTTNRQRTDSQRFYEGLGFQPSHVGYKLSLD